MADWDVKWPEERPRWGTYSVKAHQELGPLIADLLMHDVLVFPCPDDDGEFLRWKAAGWDPELLALRVNQLGDHAVVIPWDPRLRDGWQAKWWAMPSEERNLPEAAFNLTAAMTADLPLTRLMGIGDDRLPDALLDQPRVHPAFEARDARLRASRESLELIAAFRTDDDAVALTSSGSQARTNSQRGIGSEGIRLRLRLEVPEEADEATLFRTLDLVQDADFQHARRRLWSWEQSVSRHSDSKNVSSGLQALVEDYNTAVRRQVRSTRRSWVFLIVPALAGMGLDAVTGGGVAGAIAGIGSSIIFDRVRARFPSLPDAATRASHHPGSAVAGMLAITGPAAPPRT